MDYIDLMLFHYIHKKTLEPSTKKEIQKPELFILASPQGELYRLHMWFCTMVQISFNTYPSKINGSFHKITQHAPIGGCHLESAIFFL